MITIKDIAKYCNVSVTTVSYALNGNKEISEETRKKVLQAAKELNYTPNAYARGLKRRKTYNIGVVVSGFEGPIHHNVLAGIAVELKKQDSKYRLVVALSDNELSFIKEKNFDLAIIMDSKANEEEIFDISKIVPIITFDHSIKGDNIFNTTIDNMQGIYLETKDLISKGRKRIAFLSGSKRSCHNKRRFEGYVKALVDSNMIFDESLVYDADAFTESKGFEVINELLESKNELEFDSIICSNDELAIGAIKALTNKGYKVPEDVLVAGFDNIEKGQYFSPSLSTVSIDWFYYGTEMAKLALKILSNKKVKSFNIVGDLIERESTKVK